MNKSDTHMFESENVDMANLSHVAHVHRYKVMINSLHAQCEGFMG